MKFIAFVLLISSFTTHARGVLLAREYADTESWLSYTPETLNGFNGILESVHLCYIGEIQDSVKTLRKLAPESARIQVQEQKIKFSTGVFKATINDCGQEDRSGHLLVQSYGLDRWVRYSRKDNERLSSIAHEGRICYTGTKTEAQRVLRKLARNTPIPGGYLGQNGRFYKSMFKLRPVAEGLQVEFKLQGENVHFKRLIRECSSK